MRSRAAKCGKKLTSGGIRRRHRRRRHARARTARANDDDDDDARARIARGDATARERERERASACATSPPGARARRTSVRARGDARDAGDARDGGIDVVVARGDADARTARATGVGARENDGGVIRARVDVELLSGERYRVRRRDSPASAHE